MTNDQLAELASLARAASPGPWECQTSNGWRRVGTTAANRGRRDGDVVANGAASPANMAFIAAASPATVLELIARIAELEQDAARYRAVRAELISDEDRYEVEDAMQSMLAKVCRERGDDAYPTEAEFDVAIDAAMMIQSHSSV